MGLPRYSAPAIALHWLVALMILCSLAVGLYMVDLPVSPSKLKIYSYHKWAGVTVFLLVIVRLGWRLGHPPPPLPASVPDWQKQIADALHRVLYVLILAIPLSGWLMSSAKGFQTVYFGVLPIPDLLGKDESLGDLLKIVHFSLNALLVCLLAAHVGAALKHHFIDRDDVLRRMLPRFLAGPAGE